MDQIMGPNITRYICMYVCSHVLVCELRKFICYSESLGKSLLEKI